MHVREKYLLPHINLSFDNFEMTSLSITETVRGRLVDYVTTAYHTNILTIFLHIAIPETNRTCGRGFPTSGKQSAIDFGRPMNGPNPFQPASSLNLYSPTIFTATHTSTKEQTMSWLGWQTRTHSSLPLARTTHAGYSIITGMFIVDSDGSAPSRRTNFIANDECLRKRPAPAETVRQTRKLRGGQLRWFFSMGTVTGILHTVSLNTRFRNVVIELHGTTVTQNSNTWLINNTYKHKRKLFYCYIWDKFRYRRNVRRF